MQIKAITVNAAEMMAERQSILDNNGLQVQPESSHMFAPECKVTISQEGRYLSRQQTDQSEKDIRNTRNAAAERNPAYQQERKGLKETLTEMYRESGFTGDELLERVNSTYEEIQRHAQGGIQFSLNESSKEAMAAAQELAQKAIKVEDVVIDPSKARNLMLAAQEYQEHKA